jgi:CRP/FNR family transcriptional regulator
MLNSLCIPVGMSPSDIERLEQVVKERLRVSKGGFIYHQDDEATALYGIRSGSVKTQVEDSSGQAQVTGFLLPGELLGIDGYLSARHLTHAIAMEDTELCVVRIADVESVTLQVPVLNRQLRRLTSQEIMRSQQLIMSLGVLRSEQRLAAFLLNLSQRLGALGYSPREFILRMSREDIGNHLGLTLETVSRLFSRFARDNLIRIRQREVQLLDLDLLRELSGCERA